MTAHFALHDWWRTS
ncbi:MULTISPECIES: trp operon leader peptide [Enterobacter cloacae complex]|nr:trp operon leader peptide [Enterobacter hormaechei]RYA44933.1 hypothetical protein DD603_02895 [Enterobacter cloacae complex sp. 2DZ2F2B]RYA45167.1 hypothetical protein DD605_07970 [Enterobacter cloacae complex sp. 3DZ3S2B]